MKARSQTERTVVVWPQLAPRPCLEGTPRTRTSGTEWQRALGQKRLQPHRKPIFGSSVLLKGKCITGIKQGLP